MAKNPYERFQCAELILRDELAIDRTILANERTALAYYRSALTLIIAGVTFLHFVESDRLLYFVGLVCLPVGLAVGIFGLFRYRRMNTAIRMVRDSLSREAKATGAAGAPTPRTGD